MLVPCKMNWECVYVYNIVKPEIWAMWANDKVVGQDEIKWIYDLGELIAA